MELNKLRNLIVSASQAYYGNEETILSDAEFDALMDELREKCPDDPLLSTVGSGYNVTKDNSGKKVPHKYKTVGSLGKINMATCQEYFRKREHCKKIITSKLDGGSVVIYYNRQGQMLYAATRGDGNIGIDCTDKIKKIGVPNGIITPAAVAVRGEVIIPISTFNERYPDAASPRNTAMGLMNKLDPTDEEMYGLNFVAYNAYIDPQSRTKDDVFREKTKTKILMWLAFNGFLTPAHDVMTNNTVLLQDSLLQCLLESKKGTLNPDWPSDGIVITDEYNLDDEIAYKFPPEEAETTVLSVQWDTSRFGNVIPVVHFRPVKLSGATLTKCSGFNAKWMNQMNLGIGSRIVVHRAGEVIPYIKEVLTTPNPTFLPSFCEVCGTPLKWSGTHLNCHNPECPAKTIPKILHWLYAIAPVDGLGDAILVPLINWMQWVSVKDLYLTEYETFSEYFKEAAVTENAKKLIMAMVDVLHVVPVNPVDFFIGFSLSAVGGSTAKKVVSEIGIEDFFADPNKPSEKLMALKNITVTAIAALQDNYHEMFDIYQRIILNRSGFTPFIKKDKIAITGKLSKGRKALAIEFEEHGFTVVGSINREVKYLITDDPESGSGKNVSARRLGVKVVSEAKFRELLNN